MKNSFCLGRVWYIWVAISLLLSQTVFAQNFTNQTAEIINETISQDTQLQENQSISDNLNGSEIQDSTINDATYSLNETNNSETTDGQEGAATVLSVDIFYPERLTRGESAEVKALITNTGSADAIGIGIQWLLPAGFEIISEQGNCTSLTPQSFCESIITIKTSLIAELGLNNIKVVVNYG